MKWKRRQRVAATWQMTSCMAPLFPPLSCPERTARRLSRPATTWCPTKGPPSEVGQVCTKSLCASHSLAESNRIDWRSLLSPYVYARLYTTRTYSLRHSVACATWVGHRTTVGRPLALVLNSCSAVSGATVYLRVCRQYANAMLPVSDSANKRTPAERFTIK